MITVLMPVYNAEKYLVKAISSILKQTYADFEFFIINDCSTDRSHEIITSFLSDSRIRYIENPSNLKLVATLNKGIDQSFKKYIARMDADDIAKPNRLAKQLEFMERHPEVGLLGSAFESFGMHNGIVQYESHHERIKLKQLHECHILHPSVMLRQSVLNDNQLRYNPNYLHAEDYDLWSRLSQYSKLANLTEVLMKYRQSNTNISHRFSEIQERNSNIVKGYLFAQLGIKDMSEKELDLYRRIAYFQYPSEESELIKSKQLLEKMLIANRETQYFTDKFLEEHVAYLWYHMCYNTLASINRWAFFKSSFLCQLGVPNIKEKGKMYIKSMINYS